MRAALEKLGGTVLGILSTAAVIAALAIGGQIYLEGKQLATMKKRCERLWPDAEAKTRYCSDEQAIRFWGAPQP